MEEHPPAAAPGAPPRVSPLRAPRELAEVPEQSVGAKATVLTSKRAASEVWLPVLDSSSPFAREGLRMLELELT